MIPKYIPIVRAMQGEFDAFKQLPAEIQNKILPLFELPKLTDRMAKNNTYNCLINPVEVFLQKKINGISAARGQLPILFDISRWSTDSTIESGEHILSYSLNQLARLRIPVIPVIGYDRWNDDDVEYSNAIINIDNPQQKYCLRLDSYAFEDMIEESYFYEKINDIIDRLNIDVSRCSVILDFGDVTKSSIEDIQETLTKSIDLLSLYQFKYISISGCSVSTLINNMVSTVDSTASVLRREMIAWKASRELTNKQNFVFGDYGIVSPEMKDDIIAPHANGKIRYTYSNNYLVARGHSLSTGNKGEQRWDLSRQIVQSNQYMGEQFSWGDKRILSCANEEFKGNPSNWVAIDTNHHIHTVLAEVFEFERSTVLSVNQELVL